jgi:hypothetical protein
MIDVILTYFSKDPLKVLYLFGGAGGIWFWIDKWANRTRIQVTIKSEIYDPQNQKCKTKINFSCRNLGKATTSLNTKIVVSAYTKEGKYQKYDLILDGKDHDLQPHKTIQFTASADLPASYFYAVFKAYKFDLTVGLNKTIFTYASYKSVANRFKYDLGAFRFKYFKVKPRKIG